MILSPEPKPKIQAGWSVEAWTLMTLVMVSLLLFAERLGYCSGNVPLHVPCRHAGWVAQLVEQRTENPCVGGSIPPPATTS